MNHITREEALALDAADPLRSFRDRFVNEGAGGIVSSTSTATRSAGSRSRPATRDRLTALVAEWGERLVSGWPAWIDAPARVGGSRGRIAAIEATGTVLETSGGDRVRIPNSQLVASIVTLDAEAAEPQRP